VIACDDRYVSIDQALGCLGSKTQAVPDASANVADVLAWVAQHGGPCRLAEAAAAAARRMLDQATGRLNVKNAAAGTGPSPRR